MFFFLVRGFSEVLVQFPKEGGSVWMEDKVETKAVSGRLYSLFLVSSQVEVCDLGRKGVFSEAIRKAET